MSYATTPKPQAELDAKLDRSGDTVESPFNVGAVANEGGEIRLLPGTENTIGTVILDSYLGVFRIYEQGSGKGVQLPFGQVSGFVNMLPLGAGQTLKDVTASRPVGTTHQNLTGRAIFAFVRYANNCPGLDLSADNVTWAKVSTSGYPAEAILPIPAGHYVKMDSGTIYEWWELS